MKAKVALNIRRGAHTLSFKNLFKAPIVEAKKKYGDQTVVAQGQWNK